jgi:hypothetical protein
MTDKTRLYSFRVAMVTGIFAAGFLSGSLTQRSAEAQMGEIGSGLMQKAAGSGGAIGSVAKLGTTINDMEKQLNGLQKNLGVLKNIRSALGGAGK